MSLKTAMSEDVRKVFFSANEFAETVTYRYPDNTEKTISAVIVHKGLDPAEENAGRSLKKQAELFIAKSDIASIDRQQDRIVLHDAEGVERIARIHEVLHSDEGIWHVLAGW